MPVMDRELKQRAMPKLFESPNQQVKKVMGGRFEPTPLKSLMELAAACFSRGWGGSQPGGTETARSRCWLRRRRPRGPPRLPLAAPAPRSCAASSDAFLPPPLLMSRASPPAGRRWRQVAARQAQNASAVSSSSAAAAVPRRVARRPGQRCARRRPGLLKRSQRGPGPTRSQRRGQSSRGRREQCRGQRRGRPGSGTCARVHAGRGAAGKRLAAPPQCPFCGQTRRRRRRYRCCRWHCCCCCCWHR